MTATSTPPAKSAAKRTRALPVAEIFSVERTEGIGTEAVVTCIVGDAEHTPHSHGLRAPVSRWAQIMAGLSADPIVGERFCALVAAQLGRAQPLAAPVDRAPLLKPSGTLL